MPAYNKTEFLFIDQAILLLLSTYKCCRQGKLNTSDYFFFKKNSLPQTELLTLKTTSFNLFLVVSS